METARNPALKMFPHVSLQEAGQIAAVKLVPAA